MDLYYKVVIVSASDYVIMMMRRFLERSTCSGLRFRVPTVLDSAETKREIRILAPSKISPLVSINGT